MDAAAGCGRLGPADDATGVTAAQVRGVVERIIAAGHWRDGDPDILAVFDSGYDLTRLAWLLAGLPVEVMGGCAATGSVLPARRGSRARTAGGPARGRAQAGGPGHLARPGGDHGHRDRQVRHRCRHGLGQAAPAARRRAGWEGHDGELPPSRAP